MFRFHRSQHDGFDALLSSKIYDQDSFYQTFLDDLKRAQDQVIIESPFITTKRMNILLPIFEKLLKRGVRLVVNTKPLNEHEQFYRVQAERAIAAMQKIGVVILLTAGHHRKIAMIDKQIIWEGSLNILSQNDSCEIMRRINSERLANQMLAFLKLDRFTEVVE